MTDRPNAPAAEPRAAARSLGDNPVFLTDRPPPDDPYWPYGPDAADAGGVAEAEWDAAARLYNVAAVKFFEAGRHFDYDAGDLVLRRGDLVVVERDRGQALAFVALPSRRVLRRSGAPRILRPARQADVEREAQDRAREQEAYRMCRERIDERKLDMKLLRAEMAGPGKFVFTFTSEERIDFRDLVHDLASGLHARIEMRQTGARDSTKIVGGIGPCGLQLCCNTFLQEFAPVSIRHAKDQSLALNPQKVTGMCGRLMCCLVYEEAFYRAQRKLYPKVGKRVKTAKGDGRVKDVDVLAGRIRVQLESGEYEDFAPGEVTPMFPTLLPRGPGAPAGPAGAAPGEPPEAEDDDDDDDEGGDDDETGEPSPHA